jgi:hypothetical protein
MKPFDAEQSQAVRDFIEQAVQAAQQEMVEQLARLAKGFSCPSCGWPRHKGKEA